MMKERYILLLTTYCHEDGCNEGLPCEGCLRMCNVAKLDGKGIHVIGDYGLMRDAENKRLTPKNA